MVRQLNALRATIIGMVLASVVAVGIAAQAQGGISATNHLQGSFKQDSNSSLSFGVKLNRQGKAVSFTRVKYANVDVPCDDGTVLEISGNEQGRNLTPQEDHMLLVTGHATPSSAVNFNAFVNNAGTKAHGWLYAYDKDRQCTTGATPADRDNRFTVDLVR
jgi:hypothetical protein